MEKIEWSEEISVNNKMLDQHHKQIITYINEIVDAVYGAEPIDKMRVLTVLPKLHSLGHTHIKAEEKYLSLNNYPAFEEHADQHEFYLDQISRLVSQHLSDSKFTAFANLLHRWWSKHIMEEDMAYKRYFESQKTTSAK